MADKLVQVRINGDIKDKADAIFAKSGITSSMAFKIMMNQVANEGTSPLDGVFIGTIKAQI